MTSMPASRSARAMILAPRSCPSRPGFATTTRILRLLTAPDTGAPVEAIERPERFLVRKLGAEFLVPARDIEWLEAAENYVNLHVRGRVYPLRSTMTAIQERLDPQRFVRVHRSHIVNLDFLEQIEPLDTGDARLLLKDGSRIPCSRRYRPALRQA